MRGKHAESVMIRVGRIKEAAGNRIEEAFDHDVGNLFGKVEVGQIGGCFVGIEAGDGSERIIVEQSGDTAVHGVGIGVGDDVYEATFRLPGVGKNAVD